MHKIYFSVVWVPPSRTSRWGSYGEVVSLSLKKYCVIYYYFVSFFLLCTFVFTMFLFVSLFHFIEIKVLCLLYSDVKKLMKLNLFSGHIVSFCKYFSEVSSPTWKKKSLVAFVLFKWQLSYPISIYGIFHVEE